MTVCGVVLAAGASTRMGCAKPLARLGGGSFVEHTLRALLGLDEVVVVVAEPHGQVVRDAVRPLGVRCVDNAEPWRGMLSSLQVGLRALPADARAAVVALVDHPRVRPATVAMLVEAWRWNGAALVRPAVRGRRGHPYLLDRASIELLLRAPAESSARDVLRAVPGLEVEVPDIGVLDDLDTPEAVRAADYPEQ